MQETDFKNMVDNTGQRRNPETRNGERYEND